MPSFRTIAAVISDRLKGRIARGAVDTFALRLFNAGMRFLISLALARMLGAAGFGAYSFALACVGVLGVPALLGLDGLIVREVAGYHAGTQWGLLNGLLRRANQVTLLASTGLALTAAGVAWALSPYLESPMVMAFWVGLIALPVFTQIRIKQAALLGLRHTVAGQAPEILVQPVLFLLMLGVIAATPGMVPKVPVIVGLFVAAAAGALVVAAKLLQDTWPEAAREAEPEYSTPAWIGSARTFFLTAGMNVLGASLGVLMLGPMEGAEATGIYGIATAAAALIALPLTAINIPMAPAVAGIFTEGNKEELQRIATKAARGALVLSLPMALIYALFGHWILLLFGAEFTAGYTPLIILSIGQVVNAGMGSAGVLLQMTGHEREVAKGLAIALLFNVAANLILIPLWGAAGAAIGASGNMILWNILLTVWVRRKLGIRPTVMG